MESFDNFKLWDYAVSYWQRHLEKIPGKSWPASLKTRVAAVFSPESHSLLNLCRAKPPERRSSGYLNGQWNLDFSDLVLPLYYTASIGAFWLTKELLDLGYGINECSWSSEFGTALQAATAHGHQDIVQLLIKRGADVNLKGGRLGSALVCAAAYGHIGIVKILLKKRADVDLHVEPWGSALRCAASHERLKIMKLLLKNNADVNLPVGDNGNILFEAVAENRVEVARLLFSHRADIGPRGQEWKDLVSRMRQRRGQPGQRQAMVLRLHRFRRDPKSFLGSISEQEEEESEEE